MCVAWIVPAGGLPLGSYDPIGVVCGNERGCYSRRIRRDQSEHEPQRPRLRVAIAAIEPRSPPPRAQGDHLELHERPLLEIERRGPEDFGRHTVRHRSTAGTRAIRFRASADLHRYERTVPGHDLGDDAACDLLLGKPPGLTLDHIDQVKLCESPQQLLGKHVLLSDLRFPIRPATGGLPNASTRRSRDSTSLRIRPSDHTARGGREQSTKAPGRHRDSCLPSGGAVRCRLPQPASARWPTAHPTRVTLAAAT